MADASLLGYLTSRYAPHPENWATEALWYILDRSYVAPMSHDKLNTLAPLGVLRSLRFRIQAVAVTEHDTADTKRWL